MKRQSISCRDTGQQRARPLGAHGGSEARQCEAAGIKRWALRGNVVTPDRIIEGGTVVVEGERIAAVLSPGERPLPEVEETIDYSGKFIAPGLINLHLHGAMGHDVIDGTVEGLEAIAAHEARCGVSGFVPTTLSASVSKIGAAIRSVKEAALRPLRAEILGLNLEGPFLNPQKAGAQNVEFIKAINIEDVRALAAATRGLRTLITVAPEHARNLGWIPALRRQGWVVSIGHSSASYDLALKSFSLGITHATHLFNAMGGFVPREPGVIGAVLDTDNVVAELIADGVHVHPASLRIAIRQKGPDRICLITDSMNATGLADGEYREGGLDVVLRAGQARLKEGGALAGSLLTLNRAVKNIVDWTGLSVSDAVKMASLTPARVLGLEKERGSIEPGKLADIVVFDPEFNLVETLYGRRLPEHRRRHGRLRQG
jgi:N-acetylglucosamine-6-phosphate deacetylase